MSRISFSCLASSAVANVAGTMVMPGGSGSPGFGAVACTLALRVSGDGAHFADSDGSGASGGAAIAGAPHSTAAATKGSAAHRVVWKIRAAEVGVYKMAIVAKGWVGGGGGARYKLFCCIIHDNILPWVGVLMC